MTTELDPRTEYDREVFRRVAIILAVWTLLLVLSGLLLIVFGDGLRAIAT